jgi:putative membrane protein
MTAAEPFSDWQRISPLSVIFYLFHFGRRVIIDGLPGIIALAAGLASVDAVRLDWILRGLAALAAVALAGAVLSWLRFRFRVTEDRVLLRRGVLHREELNIEFSRVQNVNIKEPFYMRPLGLAVLGIDTAGSQKKEILLAGVSGPVAQILRETILAGSGRQAGEDQTDSEIATVPGSTDPTGATLLVSRSRRDIVIYGLTTNFMLWALIALGALFSTGEGFERMMGWVLSNYDVEQVIDAVRDRGGLILLALLFLVVNLLLLMVLPLISVIGALFRYNNYRMTLSGETYRRTSGLLTRHEESLKRHKIQAVVWKQNFIARLFKRINIQLRQASAGTGLESGQLPSGSKSTFVVPALHPPEALDLTAGFLQGCRPAEAGYSQVDHRRYMLFTLLFSWLPVILAVLVVPTLLVSWRFGLLAAAILMAGWLIVNQCWKKLGYGVDGEFGFVRHGFIGSQTTIFPLFKVQRVDIRQTPIQHRKGLAHLTIHLASHSVKVPYIAMHDAAAFRDLALYHAESSSRPWY